MRAHTRYPTTMPCWIELGDGKHISGWVEDISVGGAGIRVSQDLGGLPDFTLVLTGGTEPLRLPCNVRATRDLWQTRFVHARFRRLSVSQQEAVDAIVGELAVASRMPERPAEPLRRLLGWLPRRG